MSVTLPNVLGSFTLQNAGAGSLTSGIATLGQVFAAGELPAGSGLVARIGGAAVPVQMDVKTTWPDGSAKMVVLAVQRPDLAPGAGVEVVLERGAAAAAPALDLGSALTGQSFTVDLAIADQAPLQVDVLAALKTALANGTASFWQRGELTTEARVEVLVPNSSMRMLFDVTAFKGGGFTVEAQFANDRAMEAVGGRLSYDVSVRMNGQEVLNKSIADHQQYQAWQEDFASNPRHGGQGLGDPTSGWLNIRQDIAELGRLGIVADYDLTLRPPESLLQSYQSKMALPDWSEPLSGNHVARYMPDVGGRPDIGITTQPNTAWLVSQDPRAASFALGQADAGVPWRFWNTAEGGWLDARDYPKLFNRVENGGLTQPLERVGSSPWVPEAAHQPDLYFVPYLLTGQRWLLDNLNAQAAWNTLYNWPGDTSQGERYNTITGQFDLVARNVEVRAAAWALRQVENAAWAAPDGSAEQTYFRSVADINWQWLVAQLPTWTQWQGETYGYIPYNSFGIGYALPWQQDYFASTAISAASRGSAEALQVLNWMKNFLIGRFEQDPAVFNPRDGVNYMIFVGKPPPGATTIQNPSTDFVKTWAEMGQLMITSGRANGDGWARSDGNYGMWALSTLAGIWHLTGDARAKAAYEKLAELNPPHTAASDFARDLSSSVTIPGVYGFMRRR